MNVLSLFDGLSGGQIALNRANIKYDNYFASEIDTHAIKVTMANYPNTIQLGDVTKVFAKDLPKIDLLIGGFPCQDFSIAGKRAGLEGDSGKLFFELLRLKNEINPKYFLFENNQSMKREIQVFISEKLGLYPVRINSSLVSAQQRDRIYWTNIRTRNMNLFGDIVSDIPQPKDRKIILKDVLETEVDKKYYLSEMALRRILPRLPKVNPEKTYSVNTHNNTESGSHTRTGTLIKVDIEGNAKSNQEKASCLTAGGHSGGNHSDMDLIIDLKTMSGSSSTRRGGIRKDKAYALDTDSFFGVMNNNYLQWGDQDNNSQAHRAYLEDNKVGTLGTGNAMAHPKVLQINPSTESGNKQPYQPNRIYDKNGLLPHLNTDARSPMITEKSTIRRLTEVECERLQTIPDGFTNHVSSSQRYKMIGNGFTIEVISHILSFIPI